MAFYQLFLFKNIYVVERHTFNFLPRQPKNFICHLNQPALRAACHTTFKLKSTPKERRNNRRQLKFLVWLLLSTGWGQNAKKNDYFLTKSHNFLYLGFFGMGNTMRAISKYENAYMTLIQEVLCIEAKISDFLLKIDFLELF
jgi:hypothetical protein